MNNKIGGSAVPEQAWTMVVSYGEDGVTGPDFCRTIRKSTVTSTGGKVLGKDLRTQTPSTRKVRA